MSSTDRGPLSQEKSPPPSPVHLAELFTLIRPLFRQHRWRLAAGFAGLIGVDFLQLIIPRFLKAAVDGLSSGTIGPRGLLHLSLLILLTAAGVTLLRFVWRTLIIGFSRLLERALRNRIFDHILNMDRAFFERWLAGDIMAHASNDLSSVQMACGMGMVAAFDAIVMSCAAITFMLVINVKLTLLALLPMPLLAICTRILSGRLHYRFNLVQEQFSLLTECARTSLVSIKLIKGYVLEKLQARDFERLGQQYAQSNVKVAVIQGLLFPIATVVGNIGMLCVLYFGGRLVVEGTLSLGEFVAFMTYLAMLVWPMMAVGWVANLAQRGVTSLRRVYILLQAEPALKDNTQLPAMHVDRVNFRCDHLTFTYPAGVRPALEDISLSIEAGVLGVTGRTGSGKSTLCKLLVRQYPVADDVLFFAGHDVNTLSLAAVRSHIAYVGQEPILFADTLAANIAFGRPEASTEEIEAAARAAAVHGDILRFPDRYEARIGERGVKLSGGQRQRIALARALLTDRPVLIIDDALNAIDVETEQEVLAGLKTYLKGKTVIIVSHRINVLRQADRICIIEEGRIAEQGSHDDLAERSSFYRSMITKQLNNA